MAWTSPRTWVTGEVVTAANMNTHVRDNLNALSTALLIPNHVGNGDYQYFSQGISFELITGSVDSDTLYAMPITIPNPGAYDRIGFTGTAGTGNVRLGIYNDNGGEPGALVQDMGVATLTSGVAEKVIDPALDLDRMAKYWMVALFDVNATIYRSPGNSLTPGGWPGLQREPFTYGSLPNPFGTVTLLAAPPAIYLVRA